MKHTTQEPCASRALLFSGRTIKEILRDPLSFVFCLGLPVVMLVGMYALFSASAPAQFSLAVLTPGIAVFSNAFAMLYMALLVSRDRSTAFLCRLYTSPMKTADFVAGYALPGMLIGFCQLVICYLTAVLTGLVAHATDWTTPRGILLAILTAIPMMVTYVFIGILFGCLFSDKAAPGLCSIIISGGGFLSGAWTPIETLSEGFRVVCRCLPFYPAVLMGRSAVAGLAPSADNLWIPLGTTVAYAVVLAALTVLVFAGKTRREAE